MFTLYAGADASRYIGDADTLADARYAARTLLTEGERGPILIYAPGFPFALERFTLNEHGHVQGQGTDASRQYESGRYDA